MRDPEGPMKQVIDKFIDYLRYERNASQDTITEYRRDTQQFAAFLTPPGEKTLPLDQVDHVVIREYVSLMFDQALERSSVARRLGSFQHHCHIDGRQCDKGNAGDDSYNL